nr:MAG TPA: hypothetical protein [Caudoviricetes sp.]
MGNVSTKRGRTGGFQGAKLYNRNGSSVFCPIQKNNYSKNTVCPAWHIKYIATG